MCKSGGKEFFLKTWDVNSRFGQILRVLPGRNVIYRDEEVGPFHDSTSLNFSFKKRGAIEFFEINERELMSFF